MTMERNSEEGLVRRLKAGEDAAFEELVRTHAGKLNRVILRLIPNEADAADVLQDTFLSVSRAIGDFDQNSRLATWLHRIAVNAALMMLRSRRRKPECSIEDLLARFNEDGHHTEMPHQWQESASAMLEREENRRLVRQAIDQLPETYRTVLLLRDIEEMDTEFVAQVLSITPNAVKVRLHRAHQALRTLLERLYGRDLVMETTP